MTTIHCPWCEQDMPARHFFAHSQNCEAKLEQTEGSEFAETHRKRLEQKKETAEAN